MSKLIPLTRGMTTVVDDEDYEWLSQFKWRAVHSRKIWYATTLGPRANGKQVHLFMHRMILGCAPEEQGDHRDLDGLNNQRNNLRKATGSQNCANRRKQNKASRSRWKGVHFNKADGKWQGRISAKGKRYFLGLFRQEYDAALAYNLKAVELFGEFARLNHA